MKVKKYQENGGDNDMIYICVSDNFYEWTILFLDSLYLTNGDKYKVFLKGLSLTDKMVQDFKESYPNIEIENHDVDYEYVGNKFGKKRNQIELSKDGLKNGFKENNRWWSQYVLNERVKGLIEVMNRNPKGWFICYDVDVLFRKNIDPLVNFVKENDVSLYFRPSLERIDDKNKIKKDMKIGGGISGYVGEKGIRFVEKWIEIMDSKEDINKILTCTFLWDQMALYSTFLNLRNEMKWGDIDQNRWISAWYHEWKSVWGGHRKGMIDIEINGVIKKERCPTRTMLRNKVFVPEFKRLKEEQIKAGNKNANKKFLCEKIGEIT